MTRLLFMLLVGFLAVMVASWVVAITLEALAGAIREHPQQVIAWAVVGIALMYGVPQIIAANTKKPRDRDDPPTDYGGGMM